MNTIDENIEKIIIAVVGLPMLLFLLVPIIRYPENERQRELAKQCEKNLQVIKQAIKLYLREHEDRFYAPKFDNPHLLTNLYNMGYIKNRNIFRCPASGNPPASDKMFKNNDLNVSDYVSRNWPYNRPCSTPVIWEKKSYHSSRRHVVYGNGGCKEEFVLRDYDSCDKLCESGFQEMMAEEEAMLQACDPNTSPQILQKLSTHKNHYIQKAVAKNPNTPVSSLIKLIYESKSMDSYGLWSITNNVIRNLEKNQKQLSEAEYKLAESILKKLKAAQSDKTSAEEMIALSNDPLYEIRLRLAKNIHAPRQVLLRLANDKSLEIRTSVAENQNTPKQSLAKLATEKYHQVRIAVAKNPNSSLSTLIKLIDEHHCIANYAIENLEKNRKNLPIPESKFAQQILQKLQAAQSEETSVEEMLELSSDRIYVIRLRLAKNRAAPEKVLTKLAHDKNC